MTLTRFIIFLLIAKIILILQLIIVLDLILMRIFIKKIKYHNNCIYLLFIICPWIYINLVLKKLRIFQIGEKEFLSFLLNWCFINVWLSSRFSVNNAKIMSKSWVNWNKHEFHPYIRILSFISLTRKHYFNDLIQNHAEDYTF